MGWQFDRPDLGGGVVLAFRRAECAEESVWLKPRGLDAKAMYTLANVDKEGVMEIPGQDLMSRGVLVNVAARPGSAVLIYGRRDSR